MRLPLWVALVSLGVVVVGVGMASGQTTSTGSGQGYPNKTIRIVATEAGGTGDVVARLLARELTGPLGQPVIVENRAGGGVRGEIVAKATPDGYTLLVIGASHWIAPFLEKTPYDPIKEFSPITLIYTSQSILVVNPSLPVNSVKDLIALAKAKPGALNYASTTPGAALHLSGELLKSMAGINMVNVPYKGTAAALSAVLGGEVQLMFLPLGSAMPPIKAGKLRALGVTSLQPSALAPGVPTIAASGLPGFDAGNMNGMFAPAKTPEAIIKHVNQEVVRVLRRPDVKDQFFNLGVDVIGSSPAQFGVEMKADMAKWGKVIKEAGIRLE